MKTFFVLIILTISCDKDKQEQELPNNQNLIEFGSVSDTPKKFGDGVISITSGVEFGVIYNHTYHELYFTRLIPSSGKMFIYTMLETNNKWEQPQLASFSGIYQDACPSITNKGKRLYFTSFRNSTYSKIWYTDRKADNTWDNPHTLIMPDTINKNIRNIHFINDSVFYFDMEYKTNDNDIFRGVVRNNECIQIKHTGSNINSTNPDIEAVVDPQEQYMIFYSIGRTGHIGNNTIGDLYLSYKKNGEWGVPENMGIPINSSSEENWPTIDFENNILYFSTNRSSSNGFPDIFWVKLDTYLKDM